MQDCVSEALGIGKRTVGKIVSEKFGPSGSEDNVPNTPKKRKKDKPVTGIDQFDADAIRNNVFNFFTRGEFPTLAKLRMSLIDAGLFNGSMESLRHILKKIGYR